MNGLEIINFLLKNEIDQKEFAAKAGFTAPQVSRWVKTKMELSKKSEIKVLNAYPNFHKGMNAMVQEPKGVYNTRQVIRVVDATTLEEAMDLESNTIGKIEIADFIDASGGMLMKGDALSGKVNGGDVLAHKEWKPREWFQYGMIHVIFSEGHSFVRILRKHEDPDKLLLQSNNDSYDDIDLPIAAIEKLFIVNGALMRY